MRHEWLYFTKNKRTWICLIILVLLFVVYTISLLFSVRDLLIEYASARGTYVYLDNMPDSVSALYFWYGTCADGFQGNGYWFTYLNKIKYLILIPLLLAMVFVDAFVQDFNA
jgi:hypothetical protein